MSSKWIALPFRMNSIGPSLAALSLSRAGITYIRAVSVFVLTVCFFSLLSCGAGPNAHLESVFAGCSESAPAHNATIDVGGSQGTEVADGAFRDSQSRFEFDEWLRSTEGMLFVTCYRLGFIEEGATGVTVTSMDELTETEISEIIRILNEKGEFTSLRRK